MTSPVKPGAIEAISPPCPECGEPQAYVGSGIGWYCTSDKPHPKHDALVRKLVREHTPVSRSDYDQQTLALDSARRELEREKAGWAEAFRLGVFHQDRADKAERELKEAREALANAAHRVRWLKQFANVDPTPIDAELDLWDALSPTKAGTNGGGV